MDVYPVPSFMWFCELIVGVVVIVILWLLWERWNKMALLKKNGIPGPVPHLLFGNAHEICQMSTIEIQNKWIKDYGKVSGHYMGSQAVVLVADPQLAKFIQITNFNTFTNKTPPEHQFESSPYLGHTILTMRDDEWKQTRKALTKVFSTTSFQKLTVIMANKVKQFVNEIEGLSMNEEEFDFQAFSQRVTLSVLTVSSFGSDSADLISSLKELEHFQKSHLHKLIYILHICFPSLHPIRMLYEKGINYLGLTPIRTLRKVSMGILETRKSLSNNNRFDNDLMQAMVKSGMSDGTVIANCLLFFVGGFETSSNALTYVVHNLVNFPTVQNKVREEVFRAMGDNRSVDMNVVKKLRYLDLVIKESLRMYPPLIKASTRMCKHDVKYGDIVIPGGAMVQLANHHMHYDPNVWDEPDHFRPERFAQPTEEQILCFQPFGRGQRSCIGMRFVFIQIKITLAMILADYELTSGPNTEMGRLTTKCRTFALCPRNPVMVRVKKVNA